MSKLKVNLEEAETQARGIRARFAKLVGEAAVIQSSHPNYDTPWQGINKASKIPWPKKEDWARATMVGKKVRLKSGISVQSEEKFSGTPTEVKAHIAELTKQGYKLKK